MSDEKKEWVQHKIRCTPSQKKLWEKACKVHKWTLAQWTREMLDEAAKRDLGKGDSK